MAKSLCSGAGVPTICARSFSFMRLSLVVLRAQPIGAPPPKTGAESECVGRACSAKWLSRAAPTKNECSKDWCGCGHKEQKTPQERGADPALSLCNLTPPRRSGYRRPTPTGGSTRSQGRDGRLEPGCQNNMQRLNEGFLSGTPPHVPARRKARVHPHSRSFAMSVCSSLGRTMHCRLQGIRGCGSHGPLPGKRGMPNSAAPPCLLCSPFFPVRRPFLSGP